MSDDDLMQRLRVAHLAAFPEHAGKSAAWWDEFFAEARAKNTDADLEEWIATPPQQAREYARASALRQRELEVRACEAERREIEIRTPRPPCRAFDDDARARAEREGAGAYAWWTQDVAQAAFGATLDLIFTHLLHHRRESDLLPDRDLADLVPSVPADELPAMQRRVGQSMWDRNEPRLLTLDILTYTRAIKREYAQSRGASRSGGVPDGIEPTTEIRGAPRASAASAGKVPRDELEDRIRALCDEYPGIASRSIGDETGWSAATIVGTGAWKQERVKRDRHRSIRAGLVDAQTFESMVAERQDDPAALETMADQLLSGKVQGSRRSRRQSRRRAS